jgi:hypothetical protein
MSAKTLESPSGENTRTVLRVLILSLIAATAVASRLFSVIRKSESPPRRHEALLLRSSVAATHNSMA